jgi:exo-beta-1,3-glucanase (GH17 family)
MSDQYKLKITVINDLDTFVGYSLCVPCRMALIESSRNSIISNSNSLFYLTLYEDDGTCIVLNENILKKSVIKLKIVHVGAVNEE